MRAVRPGRAALPLVLAALLLFLTPPPAAHAHAALVGTDPPDGGSLETAPSEITLTFNESVQAVEDAVQLVDGDGEHHDAHVQGQGVEVLIHPGDLGEGHYFLNWRVISADDHPISGVLAFSVGSPPPAEAPPPPTEDGAERWPIMAADVLHYLGLLVFAGLLFFRIAIARDQWPPRPRHRLLRASGVVAVLGAVLAVPLGALDQVGLGVRRLPDVGAWSGQLTAEGLMVPALTVFGVVSAYLGFTRGRAPVVTVALGGAAVATAAPVLTGHSMAFGPGWLMAAADVAHLYTGAIWAGGLVGLVLLVRFARAGGPVDAAGAAGVVARFSTWAGGVVAVLGATGLAMALLIHGSWEGFLGSDHGRMLMVKLALVAVALALATWNRFRLVPMVAKRESERAGLSGLRRVLRGEAAVLALIVVVTGALVNLSPDRDEASEPQAVSVEAPIGQGAASLAFDPGEPGQNAFTLRLSDTAGEPLEPVDPPLVVASLPERDFGPVQAEASSGEGAGAFTGEIDLPLSGQWEIEIHVRVSEYEHHIGSGTVDLP